MLKSSLFIAAAFALSAQAAIAGPVGGSMTANATSEKESSLIASAIKQVKFSLSTIRGTVGGSAGKSADYKSSPKQQCDEAQNSSDEDGEAGEIKKAEPVGPEPIYFGF